MRIQNWIKSEYVTIKIALLSFGGLQTLRIQKVNRLTFDFPVHIITTSDKLLNAIFTLIVTFYNKWQLSEVHFILVFSHLHFLNFPKSLSPSNPLITRLSAIFQSKICPFLSKKQLKSLSTSFQYFPFLRNPVKSRLTAIFELGGWQTFLKKTVEK